MWLITMNSVKILKLIFIVTFIPNKSNGSLRPTGLYKFWVTRIDGPWVYGSLYIKANSPTSPDLILLSLSKSKEPFFSMISENILNNLKCRIQNKAGFSKG